ncbi:MAG TPA: hypothetical protein VK674_07030 [Candidatus Limnocylindria bacterium]|nr:hypothetical protein [Candidatus Limnocylindria bacterium]
MLEILFGPDGVGKSTYLADRQAQGQSPVVLHGTNFRSWFGAHGDLLHTHGFTLSDIPPTDNL